MVVIAQIIVVVLCLSMVGTVWVLCQKVTTLLTGQTQGKVREELHSIGILIVGVAAMAGMSLALASVAGM